MTARKNVGMWHRGVERRTEVLDKAWHARTFTNPTYHGASARLVDLYVVACAILLCFACLLLFLFVFLMRYTIGESGMGGPLLFYFYFWVANPSRCFSLCLYTTLFDLILLLSPFPPSIVFISLCGAFAVLVFLSGLSSTAYMTAFLASPAEEEYYVAVFC